MNIQEHAQLLERFDKLARHVSILQARIEVLEQLTRQLPPNLPQGASMPKAKAARV